jgi:2,4-dienoyl-CoA reductase-like NADH-dependent reductase (Old Yellow Enzyme family)
MGDTGFDSLFTPYKVGAHTLRNRFVMPGMQRGWVENGAPLPELADYYRRRAEAEVALIISESAAVDHPSATAQPMACRLVPATLPAWQRCVEGVINAGAHMLLQLWHEGALRDATDGQTISASGTAYTGHSNGRIATAAEIGEIREAFVRSARLAQQAGASGVEVHACHGYLLDQWLWAKTNTRNDGYGGPDIRDRARLPCEIVRDIRAACGSDFLISFRYSQWKQYDHDARIADTPEELGVFLGMLRAAGVDMVHSSARRFWMPAWPDSPLTIAAWTKKLGGMPTIAVGSVGLDRDVAQSFVSNEEARGTQRQTLQELAHRFAAGEFDLIAVGRSLIGDPEWVAKMRDRQFDEVRVFRKEHIAVIEKWERKPVPMPPRA